jgi:predicted transcriptional regulator
MNWTAILDDLKAWGVSQYDIAAKCGCSQASISDLRLQKTANPNYPVGQKLLELHRKHKRQALARAA